MKNIYEIRWSEEAVKNLNNIFDYLEKNWSEKEIKKFAQKLEKCINIIRTTPFAFPLSEIMKIRRIVINRQITMYYEVASNVIYIITLFDTRQNPKKIKRSGN